MDRKSVLILILLGLLCNSCIYYDLHFNRNYYREEGKGERPILPRFRLAKPEPYRLKATDQIDTTVIYVRRDMFGNIVFLRFFGNGRVSFDTLRKDSLRYNNVERSVAGYYRMRSATELEMQRFMAYSSTHASYEYSREMVRGDTIFMFSNPSRNEKLPEPFINANVGKGELNNCIYYLKQKVDTLLGVPDW